MAYWNFRLDQVVPEQVEHFKAFVRAITEARKKNKPGRGTKPIKFEFDVFQGFSGDWIAFEDNREEDIDDWTNDDNEDYDQEALDSESRKLAFEAWDDSDQIYDSHDNGSRINGAYFRVPHLPLLLSDLESRESLTKWVEMALTESEQSNINDRCNGDVNAPLIIWPEHLQGHTFDKDNQEIVDKFNRLFSIQDIGPLAKVGRAYIVTQRIRHLSDVNKVELDAASAIENWQVSLSSKAESDMKNALKEVQNAREELMRRQTVFGEKKFLYESVLNGVTDRISKTIADLQTIPNVQLRFFSDGFQVITEDIWITHEKTKYFIGQFRIKVGYNGKIGIENIMMPGRKPHPHGYSDNTYCLGGYDAALGNCLTQFDYYTMTLTVLEFIKNVSPRDMIAVSNLKDFPKQKPSEHECKPSGVASFF